MIGRAQGARRFLEEANMVRTSRVAVVAVLMGLAACALPAVAKAQPAQAVTLESFAGVWTGSAQTPSGEASLKAAFKVENGKLDGTIESSLGPIPVTAAAITEDKLVLTIEFQGAQGRLTGKLQGDRVDGVWELGSNSGGFWLTRGGAASAAPAGNGVIGEWTGEVQIAGQVFPFSLALRAEGDALAGEMSSAAGATPLGAASWKEGTLQLAFTYVGGQPVTMTGQLQDGKLAGAVDFNKGEATGTWTAARK